MNRLITRLKKKISYLTDSTYLLKELINDTNGNVLYKIVDVSIEKNVEYFKVQCNYKNALFHVTVQEIVSDLDILYALHPIQVCFIGIEYAKFIKTSIEYSKSPEKQSTQLNTRSISRYGSYNLLYKDRQGFVGFMCKDTQDEFLMDPRDIALSRELIAKFDCEQAFYIGVWAGFKFLDPAVNFQENYKKRKASHLQLL